MDYSEKKHCPSCGALVSSAADFCTKCGAKIPQETAAPGWGLQNNTPSRPVSAVKEGTLWSWLSVQKKRQQFYSENEPEITEEEYINRLGQKLQENHVPATMERKVVQWDQSDVQKLMWFVIPHADVINPMSYVLLFNHVGNFTFVEEKSYITPPKLPSPPGTKKDVPFPSAVMLTIIGLILLCIGGVASEVFDELSTLMLFAGGALALIGAFQWYLRSEATSHNETVERQIVDWNKAWDDWYNNNLYATFQENIHGELSRIFDAVFATIKQLNNELFEEKHALIESAEDNKLKDLQDLTEHFKTQQEEEK